LEETLLQDGVLKGIGGKEFEGDRAFELRILGLVNDPHAALTKFIGDLVMGDGLADHDAPILTHLGDGLRVHVTFQTLATA
jgi:hypothetical protein